MSACEGKAFAPGRVELLGNHTDYNGGWVLGGAIQHGITATIQATESGRVEVHSRQFSEAESRVLSDIHPGGERGWADYVFGVVWAAKERGLPVSGMRIVLESSLPVGAGLSSSAAVEVSVALAMNTLFKWRLEERGELELARLCKEAENHYVGVGCGLLDQATSVCGEENRIVFLDCRKETVERIPVPTDVSLLIVHSMVEHQLSGGEYNERREQCHEAAKLLGVPQLRDISLQDFQKEMGKLPVLIAKRANHIVSENHRVLQGVEALRQQDVAQFGKLMFASHESSRMQFENSTRELDQLVKIAHGTHGVLGARLTGGGFGGAIVVLVENTHAEATGNQIAEAYHTLSGVTPIMYHTSISRGAYPVD